MPEIRKHYVLDEYVIIATERARRPHEFISKDIAEKNNDNSNCPFCPGHESMIPGIIDEIKIDNDWIVRAIPNKYVAANINGDAEIKTDNEFYTYGNSYGVHEVIIETPNHTLEIDDLKKSHIKEIIEMLKKRVIQNYKIKGVKYVSLFKNKGADGGASLSHSHHQLISVNVVPEEIDKDIKAVRKYKLKHGKCPYCEIIKSEKDSYRKVIDDEFFAVFTPYASRFVMQCWIIPKRCIHSITEMTDDEVHSLSRIYKKVLYKLHDLPYNLLYKMADEKNKSYHFRIEIAPRLAKWAGFEHTTGIPINSVTPEMAAHFYRE